MGRFEAKTSMDGQATIPEEVRNALGLRPGGSVQFLVDDEGKVSVVAKKSDIAALRGIFGKHEGPPIDVDEAIMESVARKVSLSRSGDDE
jgi:AbrB family looped-hinge helix DNA binding protein